MYPAHGNDVLFCFNRNISEVKSYLFLHAFEIPHYDNGLSWVLCHLKNIILQDRKFNLKKNPFKHA